MMSNQLALEDFKHAVRKATWRDRISQLTRRSNDLMSFDEIDKRVLHTGQHYLGLQIVPIDKIVGSEGRYRDFDRAFLPRHTHTRDRWVNIDKAYYERVPLPPVELLKVGELYFVRDGNHRVSVARTRGQEFVDGFVIEIETTKEDEK